MSPSVFDMVLGTTAKDKFSIWSDKESAETMLEVELPGYEKGKISVVAREDELLVRAEGKRGVFEKTFTASRDLDMEGVKAEYKDGLLVIKCPWKRSRGRVVEVT